MTEILFANPGVIPALLKALGQDEQRKAVLEALSEHLDKTSDQTEFRRVRGNLPGLKATLNTAIPAIAQSLSLKNEEISPLVYALLGRIVAFLSLSFDADLRKAIEPSLPVYLAGLNESSRAIRAEVLDRIEAIPIRREDVVSALQKFLEKRDVSASDREIAILARERSSPPPPARSTEGTEPKEKRRWRNSQIGG